VGEVVPRGDPRAGQLYDDYLAERKKEMGQ